MAGLDLHAHEAFAEHSGGGSERVPLTPDRAVGDVTRDLLAAVGSLAGDVQIDPTPQEVHWTVPLDEDTEHASYDQDAVATYFDAASRAALVLAEYRAPYRGRSTPVNAWWGSFDLAVNLFSGDPADPPSDDFIMRNSMNAQDVTVGWWPGDARIPKPAYYSYAHPAPEGFAEATLQPDGAHWNADMGLFLLDWADVDRERRPARRRAGVRALVVQARLHRLRLGPGARGERRGRPAARGLAGRCGPAHRNFASPLLMAVAPVSSRRFRGTPRRSALRSSSCP